ncbi:nicolin-1 isoform X2 [Magallana gigas]|uniref:nicolin-1 isoform X2 n=1 Tax=Magallana gigas TaxID=29159 RepID=UPI0009753375|eukprot:XP_019925544.1 PREDICTED: nicolin-1-like isoform X2 [Crassostrea gigas]
MGDRPLHCSIKNPILLTVEDQKNAFHSGCKVIDVTFPNVSSPETQTVPISFCERVGEICFKNYYTAYVSIRVKFKAAPENGAEAGEIKWKTCVRRMRLMPSPHKESGSQDYFAISKKQFSFEISNISAMRIILQQPSPVWKEFRIEDLRLYRSSEMLSKPPPLPAWLTEDSANSTKHKLELQTKAKEKGIPNLESISSSLQELWGLSEEMAINQSKTEIGRYEVDGCYEVNLLAYT